MLRFMGLQRVGHNRETELNWTDKCIPFANRKKISFFLSNRHGIFFFFFLSEFTLDRTFSTMLNRSGESEHPFLVPYLSGKAF